MTLEALGAGRPSFETEPSYRGLTRKKQSGFESDVTAVCLKRRPSPGATPGASDVPPVLAKATLDSTGRDLVSLYKVDDILRNFRATTREIARPTCPWRSITTRNPS